MPYRRTENVARRLAARHAAIIAAAREAASEGGMAAVQIAAVAQRAGIAAGTVYRYFPGKIDLVAALLTEISEREIGAAARRRRRRARPAVGAVGGDHDICGAGVAPPASCLCGDCRAGRGRARRRAAYRRARRSLPNSQASSPQPSSAAICRTRMRRWARRHSSGLLIEGLIGPLAPDAAGRERAVVQSLALVALRALGVADARARGLVVSGIRDQ